MLQFRRIRRAALNYGVSLVPFPSSPRTIFGKDPIAEVICQLRFPTILDVAVAPPAAFQNRIRTGYPIYEADSSGLPQDMIALLSRLPHGPPDSQSHKFLTTERSRSVTLTPDFIALSETNYEEWKNLRERILSTQAALEEVYSPSFYQRVGLRYINVLDLSKLGLPGRPWRDLLNPVFVGMSGEPDVAPTVVGMSTQASLDISEHVPNAKVTIRYGPQDDGTFRFDSDFYISGEIGGPDVREILDDFNKLNGNLFRWLVPRDGELWASLEPSEVA